MSTTTPPLPTCLRHDLSSPMLPARGRQVLSSTDPANHSPPAADPAHTHPAADHCPHHGVPSAPPRVIPLLPRLPRVARNLRARRSHRPSYDAATHCYPARWRPLTTMRSHGSLPGSRRASAMAVLCTSTVVGNYAPLRDLHWVLAVAFIACIRPQIRSSGCSGSAGEHAPSTLLCVRRQMGKWPRQRLRCTELL
ncbi:uncharacterized protein LOC125553862 [Triticum urartu]|uniref:uncharacterized protein LOC125553862 n=1 Tax=Triticum urartu TaxID=4572 RepID=UPI002044A684|nr:uncharacterized protein LOC125553862 [Triticum urartu]